MWRVRLLVKTIYEAKSIGEVITYLKEERGLSNESLGKLIDISKTGVFNLEHENGRPYPWTLDKLAAYGGVTREWLYEMAYHINTRPVYSHTTNGFRCAADC